MTSEIELKQFALKIRYGIINAIGSNKGGHIGGSLDLAELLAVLYSDFMRVRPEEPRWAERDFFVSSKGHAGPVLYSTLALKGFFPYEKLLTLNKEGTSLPGHCDRNKVEGVDVTTGSLGQGISIACGIALGAKISKTDQRIFCVTGDGESGEGEVWEAAMFAAHHKLDNLVAFLDWNKMQIDGSNDEVLSLGNPEKKYEAFGWNSLIVKGNDVLAIQNSVRNAIENPNGKPTMIILDTIKGAGLNCISSMKNNHCVGFPLELYEKAKNELLLQAQELGVEL